MHNSNPNWKWSYGFKKVDEVFGIFYESWNFVGQWLRMKCLTKADRSVRIWQLETIGRSRLFCLWILGKLVFNKHILPPPSSHILLLCLGYVENGSEIHILWIWGCGFLWFGEVECFWCGWMDKLLKNFVMFGSLVFGAYRDDFNLSGWNVDWRLWLLEKTVPFMRCFKLSIFLEASWNTVLSFKAWCGNKK